MLTEQIEPRLPWLLLLLLVLLLLMLRWLLLRPLKLLLLLEAPTAAASSAMALRDFMVRPRDAVRSAPDVSRLSSRMASALRRAATARLRSTSVSLRMSLVGTVSTPRVSQPSPCCKSMIAGTPILAAAAAASTTSRRVEDGADVACRGCRIFLCSQAHATTGVGGGTVGGSER